MADTFETVMLGFTGFSRVLCEVLPFKIKLEKAKRFYNDFWRREQVRGFKDYQDKAKHTLSRESFYLCPMKDEKSYLKTTFDTVVPLYNQVRPYFDTEYDSFAQCVSSTI